MTKKNKKLEGCPRTLEVIVGMGSDTMLGLLHKYCRPDMRNACINKFGFELCKFTIAQRIADEKSVYDILLDDNQKPPDAVLNVAPDWICKNTYEVANKFDKNQVEALIERYCLNKLSKRQSKMLYGFELDQKTLEWLRDNIEENVLIRELLE